MADVVSFMAEGDRGGTSVTEGISRGMVSVIVA